MTLSGNASLASYQTALRSIAFYNGSDAPSTTPRSVEIVVTDGAATSNVFTRALLALYGEIPWRGVPVMPVEIMLLPKWFPFHLDKVSYWSRTVIVPLLILMALKPRAENPRGVPFAIVRGRMGGSAMTAAALNALARTGI